MQILKLFPVPITSPRNCHTKNRPNNFEYHLIYVCMRMYMRVCMYIFYCYFIIFTYMYKEKWKAD